MMIAGLQIWARRFLTGAIALGWVAASMAAGGPTSVATTTASRSAVLRSLPSAIGLRAPRNAGSVKALQTRLRQVVDAVSPSVVAVGEGGSGVVVSGDGYVLCVAHVGVRAGRKMIFTFPDGRKARGVTLGNCGDVDAGLMKITDPGPWPYVDMGRSGEAKTGQWCLALSYPTTFEHGKPPVVRVGRVLSNERYALVTDCTIMGGDSGGPLFDLEGEVIGISSTCNDSLLQNRHVPVDRFRDDWARLAKGDDFNGRPNQAELLGLRPDALAREARIGSVVSRSPADEAGLKAGDVILRFDGQPVRVYDDLRPLAARHHPGCTCEIEVVVRRGEMVLKFHTSFAETGPSDQDHGVYQDSEKNSDSIKAAVRKVVSRSSAATVRILSDGTEIALGTVVDGNGYIATKASLLQGKLICRFSDGRELAGTIVGEDLTNDLALLRVDAKGLPAVVWRKGELPPSGSIVFAAGATDDSAVIGVVSTDARNIRGSAVPAGRQGWLGVSLGADETGVIADEVVHDSPAERAGLRPGDRINAINGHAMASTDQVRETIRGGAPGGAMMVSVRRDERLVELAVTLGRQPGGPAPEDNWGGGPFSERRWGFPSVLPHDIAVPPNDCGGPLVDTDGKVVGINIARALRVSTFALPAETVQRVVRGLIANSVRDPMPVGDSAE